MDRGRGRKACIRNSESRFVVNTIYTFLLYGNGWQIGKIQDIGKHGMLIKVKFKAVVNAAQNEPTELDLLRCHHDIVK